MLNEEGRALCANCQTPLTAYAGQLRDAPESSGGKLAAQVAHLNTRPPIIGAMALFDVLFALFWPLAFVVGAFAARQQVNGEGTNYIFAAIGTVGPALAALVLIPAALALCALAWATWTQRPSAWIGNAYTLGAFALLALRKFPNAPIMSLVWIGVAGVLAYVWFRPETKAWFGQ
jgi:hypothetical protein